ncbi:MAG TPA: RDD family protein [Ensifer sp.]|jgi:uncharacterized RDD family membrane protein YckC|uniref:RDD family protein n=1 Tax=Ensifer sp. TaxID=1872086 RepID=UPI002E15CD6A|nr:RDD family protein [Ensifer sp.]
MTSWHYAIGPERHGPVGTNRLLAMIARGELASDVLVWRNGQENWTEARDAPDIKAAVRRVTPVPHVPDAAPPPVPAYPLARPWPRFLARIFDLLLLYIPAAFLAYIAALVLPKDIVDINLFIARAAVDLESTLSLFLLVQLISFAMLALMTAAFGASPGKLIFGVRVVPLQAKRRLGFHLEREFMVWLRGLAFSIVPVSVVTAIIQYFRVAEGHPADYDQGKARVEGKPISSARLAGGIVATLLAPFIAAMAFQFGLGLLPSPRADESAELTTRWTNSVTLGEARFDRPFRIATLKGNKGVNPFFETGDFSVTMYFERDADVGGGVGSADYAKVWTAELKDLFVVTSPWRPLTIDGKRAYRASATRPGNDQGDVELTFVLTDAGAWRVTVYAGASKVSDLDMNRNVTALFETID